MRYLLRRIGHGVLLLGGVSVLTFMLLQAAPGDFFTDLRLSPDVSAKSVDALRAERGLDRPLPLRYSHWLAGIARGDFGRSLAYNMPAAELLKTRARNTLLLTVAATLLAWLLAVPVALWAAVKKGGWIDRAVGFGTSFLLAVPDLFLALLFLVLAVRTGLFPVGGMTSPDFADLSAAGRARDLVHHLLLPLAAIVLGTLPMIVRHARSSIMAVLDAPFMQAARAHGLPRRTILFRYALRAAANPLISLFGFSIATLLSASLLVEIVMGWPGLGPLLLEAILSHDLNLVVGAVILSTLLLLAGNFVADLLLYAADPRIREGLA